MKKLYTILMVLGLLVTLAGTIAADEGDRDDVPDNLVRPTTDEGDVFILGNPDDPIFTDDDMKGIEEPLIMPPPDACEEGLIIAPYSEAPEYGLTYGAVIQLLRNYLAAFIQAFFYLPVA